jgi:hypothetical protein
MKVREMMSRRPFKRNMAATTPRGKDWLNEELEGLMVSREGIEPPTY